MRICSHCNQEKELEEFASFKKISTLGEVKQHYRYICKVCENKRRYENARNTPEKLERYNERMRKKARKNYYLNSQQSHDRVKKQIDNLIKDNKFKHKWITRKYGITIEYYNLLRQKQEYCCAICKKSEDEYGKPFHVDHQHDTGKVRGVLCHSCNLSLGGFSESIENLKSAIQYLENNQ